MILINVFVAFMIISGHLLNADVGYNIVYCDVGLIHDPTLNFPYGYAKFWGHNNAAGSLFVTLHIGIIILHALQAERTFYSVPHSMGYFKRIKQKTLIKP